MIRDDATEAQVQASDPSGSVWLSANAGSGKTKVLTDRVARLLLRGVAPQHILCLTYTKAAATEMQNRLFKRLGEWAMAPHNDLLKNLTELGVDDPQDADLIARARRLFARAIETPGGLKIQTIHSFCASLLRRFPIEAGVSPGFQEMDERVAKLLQQDILEEIALGPECSTLDRVARLMSGEDLTKLTAELATHRAHFDPPAGWSQICEAFDIPPDLDEVEIINSVITPDTPDLLTVLLTALRNGSKQDQGAAAKLAGFRVDAPDLSILESVFLFGAKTKAPYAAKVGNFPTKDTQAKLADSLDDINDLMQRVEDARPGRLALAAARKTKALHDFAGVFLSAYEAHKSKRGWLDFDDLILAARRLLTNPAVAQWVLFRLDGGIDHILVDEAQDTSPVQWDVIERLAQEFTAGEGARVGVERTIFVVGDKKQSIYSFQGADPDGFDRMRDLFRTRMEQAQLPMSVLSLRYSFRSAVPVMRLVDDTFVNRPDHGLGEVPDHIAFKDTMPGRVDLWPNVEKVDAPDPTEWFNPVDLLSEDHHNVRLARRIAQEISRMIGTATIPDEDKNHQPYMRKVRAGDFLILVQRRSDLFHEIISACKDENLDIAGADRLRVGAELAVKDITAVLSFLSTPEDDLSLACALRSPLFSWSEGELHALAQPRPPKSYLWEALRKHPCPALDILNDLRNQTDFLRPYDLIERILTRHDGRRNFTARLGPEAEDGINALLTLALQYESTDIPSLTGFLMWLASDEVSIKRQMDSGQDQIRVMTVHGSKGLEAPIVILPDTAPRRASPLQEPDVLLGDIPMWKTKSDQMPETLLSAKQSAQAKRDNEKDRLLYVAMTRAEKWLIIASAGEEKDTSWYAEVAQGMAHAGAADHDFGFAEGGQGLRLEHGDWSKAPQEPEGSDAPKSVKLPEWAKNPVAAPPVTLPALSPSKLGGEKSLAGPEGQDEVAAMAYGTEVHLLLEHLPNHPPERWAAIAGSLSTSAEALAEATQVLTNPELSMVFAPDTLAEVSLTADIKGLGQMFGTIDRLIITDEIVTAIDFKTNRNLPDKHFQTPEGILRQLGAYVEMLEQIYPNHRIGASIVWTKTAQLMSYPKDMLTAALRRTPTS